MACRSAWLCMQRRPAWQFCDMCLPCAQSPRIMMQPPASLIATWMPSGHAGHVSLPVLCVRRALCTAHAGCAARIYLQGKPSRLYFTSRAHRTLELVLHGHGMHNSFPSQPYNARCMPVPATACAVPACHGHGMHNGHDVQVPGRPQAHHYS